MRANRKSNFIIIALFLAMIVAFTTSYSRSVSEAISSARENDERLLTQKNAEIISRLVKAEDVSSWQSVIDEYSDSGISAAVFDGANREVAQSEDYSQVTSSLNATVQNAFNYRHEAYILRSSKFLLADYENSQSILLEYIFTVFAIGIAYFALLVFTIYTFMLKPYRRFYQYIEKYEKTGVLEENRFKGYIGLVYDRFDSLTKSLERQQQTQKRIIAGISHDIRTPLTSIMGYSERLKKSGMSAQKSDEYVDVIYSKSIQICSLVDEFDEYLSYDMSRRLDLQATTIESLCKTIESQYSAELMSGGVELTVENRAGESCSVMLDAEKFSRVTANMVSNSVKHFCDRKKVIKITFESSRKDVIMRFEDSGKGVDEDKLELIFEPLYTSDKGRRVAGLGLSICREIVEGHSGSIKAERSVLGGLALVIRLPMA